MTTSPPSSEATPSPPPSRLKIAVVHHADASNVRTWSGTTLSMMRSLQEHVGDVTNLSPYPGPTLPYRLLGKGLGTLTHRRWSTAHDPRLARRLGLYFTGRLREGAYDVVFAPAASSAIAWLDTEIPIIYFSDATWRLLVDYYECYSHLLDRYRNGGEDIEQRAIARARFALFSSQWAADSAVRDYGAPAEKTGVISLGPNIESPPSRAQALATGPRKPLRMLLCGISYVNKGGPVARAALIRLLDMGVDATLTVLGCSVPGTEAHPRMRVIPFLDKRRTAERMELERIWREADLLLLPTRFDATPIVLCEAAAHGIPALGADTGGLRSVIHHGVNGYLLPRDANGEAYADLISTLLADGSGFEQLRIASRGEYEDRLNWETWGERIAPYFESAAGRQTTSPTFF